MEYFLRRAAVLRSDSFLSLFLKVSVLCIVLHTYQYFDSGRQLQPLIRLVFSCGCPFVIFFLGRLGVYWYYFVYASVLTQFMTFQNYTSFVIICVFVLLVPRMKVAALVLYALEVFSVATLHDRSPVHVLIHFSNCVLIYYALRFLLRPASERLRLQLTMDEQAILDELLAGKLQKEITFFSQNTITKKLKQARRRNGLATTDELLVRYRDSLCS